MCDYNLNKMVDNARQVDGLKIKKHTWNSRVAA